MPRRASSTILLSLQLVLVGALAFVFTPFGCALSDTVPKVDAGPQVTCNKGDDAHCQAVETNPCNHDVCNADGICEVDHVSSGAIADAKLGDCHNIVCKNGEPINTIDPTDTEDDGNPCTVDACSASGVPTHTKIPEGGTCKDEGHAGVCRSGDCEIKCSGSDDCKTPDKCAVGACDLGKLLCKFMKLDGVPVPDTTQKSGNCQDLVCVKGVTTTVDDASDLPPVNGCQTPSCSGNPLKPGLTNKLHKTPCSFDGGMICDGSGHCVVCSMGSDCADDNVPCHTPTCKNNTCSNPNSPTGPTSRLDSMQVPGDCHKFICDANGNPTNSIDQTDVPDDNNGCTTDSCDSGGTVHHDPKSNGTDCGNGLTCVAGICNGCSNPGQCNSSNPLEACLAGACVCPGTNTPYNCNSKGVTCGNIDDGCGNNVNCSGSKDSNETDTDCGGDQAKCATRCPQGKKCSASSDCVGGKTCEEGVCCESACSGACVSCLGSLTGASDGQCRSILTAGHAPKPGGSCPGGTTCGDTGNCDGAGNCQVALPTTPCGTTCSMAVQTNMHCSGTLPGTCVAGTTVGCAPYVCNTTTMTCLTSCNGNGDCIAGDTCNSNVCGSGKANGQPCTMNGDCLMGHCSDNICCNSDCTGTCMSCNVSGNVGSCTPIPENQTDPGVCDSNNGTCGSRSSGCSGCGNSCACNGSGACLLLTGQECTCDPNCTSGKCGPSGSMNCSNGADHMCQ